MVSKAVKNNVPLALNGGARKKAVKTNLSVVRATMASIMSLASVISAEEEEQVNWFQTRGLLPRTKTCPACNQAMNMQSRADVIDKYRYIYVHIQ